MKKASNRMLGLVAAALMLPTVSTMANSGLIRVTVSTDTPYRQAAPPPATVAITGKTFQLAPIKMKNGMVRANASTPTAEKASVRPHWK